VIILNRFDEFLDHRIFPENNCGRSAATPISLVQIWVLYLGGFPVSCLEISSNLAEHHTSSVL